MAFLSRHTVAAAVLAALALPVLAQPTPANPPAVGAAAAPDARKGPGEHRERHQAHMAQRAAALKEQLKLTPNQEPAWNSFTASMQQGDGHGRLDRKELDKLTTPERIDRMRAMRAQHAAEADRRGEATKAFYAVLTPEQQKTFDARAQRMGPRGEHGKHGPHGHRGHGDKPAGAAPAAQK